ncbi:MAG: glycosyltransferase family 4 protein [Patescibacteria group bacterium]|jgi:glycosyltransferase involved in cell wall biosynthesis
MRIVIATGIFIPELGGPATYAAKIADSFLALGHQVKIVSYSDQSSYDLDKNLAYPIFRVKRSNKLLNYLNYFKVLRQVAKDADVIYSFDHFSAGIPTALLASIYQKRFYIRVGGDFIWERYLDLNNSAVTLKDFYKNNLHLTAEGKRFKVISWVFKKSTGIIFTTKFQLEIFQKYYNLLSDKLFVVNNPISKGAKISRDIVNKEIIMTGRFIHKNNILNLIKAFKNISDKSYKLILIGEGAIQNKMENLIKELAISDRVFIEPKLSRDDLAKRMSGAYLAIWPSLTDISPNSMLEALSINVPVISSIEIGFDWLKDKIKTFDPREVSEITEAIDSLLDKDAYLAYQEKINKISYEYTYAQAAKDTIDILK